MDVEIGVDNDNYVEITAGLDADVTVYKAVETTEEAGGLLSMFSSLSQQQHTPRKRCRTWATSILR